MNQIKTNLVRLVVVLAIVLPLTAATSAVPKPASAADYCRAWGYVPYPKTQNRMSPGWGYECAGFIGGAITATIYFQQLSTNGSWITVAQWSYYKGRAVGILTFAYNVGGCEAASTDRAFRTRVVYKSSASYTDLLGQGTVSTNSPTGYTKRSCL